MPTMPTVSCGVKGAHTKSQQNFIIESQGDIKMRRCTHHGTEGSQKIYR